ncbi:hypothetical protein [Paeniglutamicibacter sp. NPDC091659]|uniref:hypothetical protein n=1 Tax=Paeniglutamicibacter sp. NPDC091659 TaxID=3364389 RepID=UPI0037F4FBB1
MIYWKGMTKQVLWKIRGRGMKKRPFTTIHGFTATATALSHTAFNRKPQPIPKIPAGIVPSRELEVARQITMIIAKMRRIEKLGQPAAVKVSMAAPGRRAHVSVGIPGSKTQVAASAGNQWGTFHFRLTSCRPH